MVLFPIFLGLCWLNSEPMPSDRWNNSNWLFWFFAETLVFFRISFGEFFSGFFLRIMGHLRKTFYKQLYLWAQKRCRYFFVVDIDASAREDNFRKNRLIFFGCRTKLRAWVFGAQMVLFSISGAHAGWLI